MVLAGKRGKFGCFLCLGVTALWAAFGPPALGGVIAGRINVEPSGGSLDEKPTAGVAAQTPGADLFAAGGNRGDWTLGQHATAAVPAGQPFLQREGVVLATLNELLPPGKRGGVEAAGGLTVPGNDPAAPIWVAGFSSEGNGVEANVDFAFAAFPFADGWVGAHVARDGTTLLAAGTLPPGSGLTLVRGGTRDGEVRLTLGGVDALEDGMLFTVAAGNGDNVTAVGPLPDGSGWHIRVADEGNDFRQEELCPFSFVFLPYTLDGLIGGWIAEDGRVLAGTGSFGIRHPGPGRYEMVIPGRSGDDGILLTGVAKMNPDGVEDNAIAWVYDPAANGGGGAFVIETYDQPGFDLQDVRFYAAFIPFDNQLAPGRTRLPNEGLGIVYEAAETWAESILRYRGLLAEPSRPGDTFRPFFSGTLSKGALPAAVDIAVAGLAHVWLLTDPVDTGDQDLAAWAEAAFVRRDGSTLALSGLAPVFASAAGGGPARRPVTLAGRVFTDGLAAPAPGFLCYAVPPDAVRLRALVGIEDGAGPGASVRFAVVDRHDRKPLWAGTVRPVLRARFPGLMARLGEHLGDPRLGVFDPDASLPRVIEKTAAMALELGRLAPEVPPGEDLASRLRGYEVCSRRLDEVARAEEAVWEAAPVLARIMDYPCTRLDRLRGRLEQIRATQPASADAAGVQAARLEACENRRVGLLLRLVRDDRTALAEAPSLAEPLLRIAEWVSRTHGWTTFRADNERSAISREPLAWPLRPAWTYTPPAPPAPAWPPPRADNPAVGQPLSPTLTYDHAFHVVAADGRVFFGDSVGDAVVCLDADSGAELWRSPAEGPVRLAPALWSDRVYALCDDGWLYCLEAASGRLLWRYRAGPDGTRLPGNERLISVWPMRCGICIDQGTLYAGAGLFPSQGTFLFALDALTGKELWKQPTNCVPQGFLLLSPTRLFVPTGRTPFYVFDRQNGKALTRLGQTNSWGKDLPGGTTALVINRTLAAGPGEDGTIHLFDENTAESLLTAPGRQVVVDGLTAYVLTGDTVAALRRQDYLASAKPRRAWEAACPKARTMVKVGEHLVVGGDRGVEVFAAADGTALGSISLGDTAVEGLAWHDGRLFVSAPDGRIVCLEDASVARGPVSQPGAVRVAEPEAVAVPQGLVEGLCGGKGYALFVGAEYFRLALGVARAGDLQCVVSEPDAERCGELLEALRRARVPGRRVTVHRREGPALPYRPYLFNLVVAGAAGPVPAGELYRVLRPCGGVLLAGSDPGAAGDRPVGEQITPPPDLGLAFGFRRGALPGSGRWTHGYADPGNTACSGDRVPFGPFDVLWFGRPGPQFMYERHVKAAAPLCDGGLLFVTGQDYLAGLDAYNGTILWERSEPGSGRMAMLRDCGNMATAEGLLYAAAGGRCLVIDGRRGETLAEYPVPGVPPAEARWGYVAVEGDRLVGSVTRPEARMLPGNKADYDAVWYHNQPVVTSRGLFALERATGRTAWSYTPPRGAILNPTLTLLEGRVCFVESTNPATLAHATGKVPLAELFRGGPELVALDLAGGGTLWRVPIRLDDFVHSIYMSGSRGILVLSGSRHADVQGRTLIQYQLVGVRAEDGRELWRNDNTPTRAHILDGGHGEQTQHPAIVGDIVYGPGFARRLADGSAPNVWLWQKSPQCASLSASAYCAFSRQGGLPTVAEFASGKEQRLTLVTRPGCLINTLPAGGIVCIPEGSSGCTCGYSVQTSLALCPRQPAEAR